MCRAADAPGLFEASSFFQQLPENTKEHRARHRRRGRSLVDHTGYTRQTGCRVNLAEEVICGEDSQVDQEGQRNLQMQVLMLAGV